MLNRTNRTQSATILGLNLGARSLANLAGVNMVAVTQPLRHPHQQGRISILRDGKAMKAMEEASKRGYPMPSSSPCSPSVPSWLVPSGPFVARFAVGGMRGLAVPVAFRDRSARPDAPALSPSGGRAWTSTRTPSALAARSAAGG